MSYYNDRVRISEYLKIDGIPMPETSEPVKYHPNLGSTNTKRLVDSGEMVAKADRYIHEIILKYSLLNKEHYDMLYNATIGKVKEKKDMYFDLTIPSYTPEGIVTIRAYIAVEHNPNCIATNEKDGYKYGAEGYDELHKDVEFKFIEK